MIRNCSSQRLMIVHTELVLAHRRPYPYPNSTLAPGPIPQVDQVVALAEFRFYQAPGSGSFFKAALFNHEREIIIITHALPKKMMQKFHFQLE